MHNAPAIAAVTEIRPGRYPDKNGMAMYEAVLEKFLREWPLDPGRVDGLLVCPSGMAAGSGVDIFVHEALLDSLGLQPRFAATINAGGATYGIMLQRAATAIAAGQATAVLCAGAGKFPPVADVGDDMARMVSHPDFEYIYGSFIPALYALAATRHMHERGTTREELAHVAVTARQWALRHPLALMRPRGAITVTDVLESRPIADPFRLLDCSVPCEGGGAFLVTHGDIAAELCEQPAYVLGIGEHHGHGRVGQARDFATMDAGISARRAFEQAGLEPGDVRVAELYDAFTINPIMLLEEVGLVAAGGGGEFFARGRALPGGDLPVNTYGGLLSFGHTGDASGMSVLVEAMLQVMGRAGERQVPGADIALAHVYGGMMAEHCTILFGRKP